LRCSHSDQRSEAAGEFVMLELLYWIPAAAAVVYFELALMLVVLNLRRRATALARRD